MRRRRCPQNHDRHAVKTKTWDQAPKDIAASARTDGDLAVSGSEMNERLGPARPGLAIVSAASLLLFLAIKVDNS